MGRTVLVIEDDAVLRSVIAAFLTEEGFTVEQAGDGRTGLCLAQQLQPDLILLDLPLPMHAGLEVLEQLKDHQPTRAIPILILSAYALILVRQATERADGVLPMPVDLKQLLDRINHLVKDADSRFRLLPPTSVSA